MELKFLFISLLTACLLGSNRTFMELKYDSQQTAVKAKAF